MKTGCFSNYDGLDGVSIALQRPDDFRGGIYPVLYPPWDIVTRYHRTRNVEAFVTEYHNKVLCRLDPFKVYEDLKDKVILCWEPPGEFCHRHVVAAWIMEHLGVDVQEIQVQQALII